jgi:CHASE2 domain-containing sensor protein
MASLPFHDRNSRGGSYALLLSGFGVAGLSIAGSWSTRKRIRQALLAGTVLMSCLFFSCGGGVATPKTSGVGGAVGTFQITIHGDSGNQHISTVVTLTIK